MELVDELPQGQGFLPEIQVPPLEIFDEGEQTGAFPGNLQHQAGDLFQATDHGRPQPPFSGDEFIASAALPPDGQGL